MIYLSGRNYNDWKWKREGGFLKWVRNYSKKNWIVANPEKHPFLFFISQDLEAKGWFGPKIVLLTPSWLPQ